MILQVKGIPWSVGMLWVPRLCEGNSTTIWAGSFQKSLQATIAYYQLTIYHLEKVMVFSLWIPRIELEHFLLSLSDLPAQAATPMPMLPSWTEMHRPHEEGSAPVPVRGIFVSLFSRSSNCLIFQSFISHHLSNFVNAKQSQVAEFVHISVSSLSSLWNSKK